MAKAKAKKPVPKPDEHTKPADPLDPKKVHELLGVHGPYDPPPPPIQTKGYVTFWDPGCSIQSLVARHRPLFYLKDFSGRFARDTDSWKWRQLRREPIPADLTFAEQQEQLKTGDTPAAARELVTFLVLHFLVTEERLEIGRWRCKDVVPPGQRVIVGPFSDLGLDIGTVSDEWKSPGIFLSALCTPPVKRK